MSSIRKTKPPNNFVPGGVAGRDERWATFTFKFGGYFAEQVEAGEEFLDWAREQQKSIAGQPVCGV